MPPNFVAAARDRGQRLVKSEVKEVLWYYVAVLPLGTELSVFAGNADNRIVDKVCHRGSVSFWSLVFDFFRATN
jgi:hypothetical protein